MPQLFTNNARALLAAGINESATSITIEAGKADLFPVANVGANPVPSVNNWFKATLQDSSGNVEIIYVRTRTAGSGVLSNVIRAQEGTIARSFIAGSVIGLRITSVDIQSSINVLSNNNTFLGLNTFSGAATFNGVASFTDAVTLSGSATFSGAATFSQTIAGSINGNAATVTNGVYTIGDQVIDGIKRFSNGVRVGPDNDVAFYYDSEQLAAYIQAGTTGDFKFFRFGDDGDFTAPGNITANSDIRLKRDLHVIPHALDKVRRLTGYTYTRIDGGVRQTGLIAQDVQRVLPEAVVEGDHLSVAYGNLVGLLVEAIKELETEVSKLKGD